MLSKPGVPVRSAIPHPVEIIPPDAEPLGIQDYLNSKSLKIKGNVEHFKLKLEAARQAIEDYSGRLLVTRTVDQLVDCDAAYPPVEIRLRYIPVRKVLAVYAKDIFGTETTVDTDVYTFHSMRDPYAILSLNLGQSWPISLHEIAGLRIQTICGHATPIASIDLSTNVITANRHPYANGDVVRLHGSYADDGVPVSFPGGLARLTNYYAIDVTTNTLKLSATSGGSAIDITSAGSGKLFLGEIPSTLLRAVMITAASDVLQDEYDSTAESGDISIPILAKQLARKPITI